MLGAGMLCGKAARTQQSPHNACNPTNTTFACFHTLFYMFEDHVRSLLSLPTSPSSP